MLRAALRLHSLVAYPGDFAFYVARPGRSVHSRVKASSVGVTDRRRRRSRGPFLQCVRGATPFEAGQTARDLGQPPRSLPLGHGAHDQHEEARRHRDRHFRFD